jgi:hypothetical protein
MKRLNLVNSSLAALTLAALALPASAQFSPGFGSPGFGASNSGVNPYLQGGFPNTFAYFGQSPIMFQGGSYWGWNNSNLFVGNNGIVAFPNTYDFFRVPTNYEEVEELAENAPQPVPNQDVQSSALPRTSDALQIEKERNAVIFSWNGTSDSVNRITFTLLDRSKQPIRQRIITRLPATARLTRSNRTAYYRVTVEYINGTTNSVIAPL